MLLSGNYVLKKLSDKEIDVLSTFLTTSDDLNQKKEELKKAGEMFVLKLYSAKRAKNLGRQRYILYNQKMKKINMNNLFEIESLPPTCAAAEQRSYRAYHTVQQSQGNYVNPTDFGWMADGNDIVPIPTKRAVAPEKLLELISCGCKANCGKGCGCVKKGINCTVMCSSCNGQTCRNAGLDFSEDTGILD